MLTTQQAAERKGVSRSYIIKLINAQRLKAERHGRDWAIREAALDRAFLVRRKPGRPLSEKVKAASRTRRIYRARARME